MAGNKVSLRNVISRFDRLVTKTQVRYGQATRFLRIIIEIALSKHVGVVTDDFNGVLVGTNGTICAKAPELTGMSALGNGIHTLCQR